MSGISTNLFETQDHSEFILRGKNFHVTQKIKREGNFEEKVKQPSEDEIKLNNIANETTNLTILKVSAKISKAIIQGRTAKKWNRKQLAMNTRGLSEAVIASYETGKAIPNIGQIIKIEKALGIKLTGKDFK
jgi:ribosome-binding protein aMBF1 (putative translation factor)